MKTKEIIESLAVKIEKDFDWYIALSRGGLVPACLLSQYTDHRSIDTLCVVSYDKDHNRSEPRIIQKDYSHIKGKKILVIDDLADSGYSFVRAKEYLAQFEPKEIKTLALYLKTGSVFKPDYYHQETKPEDWIEFEWEV
jgi:uncharacterized protein